jgi:hypothetical protein
MGAWTKAIRQSRDPDEGQPQECQHSDAASGTRDRLRREGTQKATLEPREPRFSFS